MFDAFDWLSIVVSRLRWEYRNVLKVLRKTVLLALALFSLEVYVGSALAEEEGVTVTFGKDAKSLHVPIGDAEVFIYPAFEDYAYMMFDVCDALGLTIDSGNCNIFPMNGALGGNAIATVIDGNRVIVYDRTLSSSIGHDGALGVIAHEIAHHYCGHLNHRTPNPNDELEADQFAGVAFRRMNLSLDQALAMTTILDDRPSVSHPAKADRENAISTGWHNPDINLVCAHAD